MATAPPLTFIVRVTRDAMGRLRGVVERVRTGRKEQFEGAEALGQIIERTVQAEDEKNQENK